MTSVEFITAGEADARYKINSNLTSDRLLCVVLLNGMFVYDVPPITNAAGTIQPRQVQPVPTEILVFDAHTGNFLIGGARG